MKRFALVLVLFAACGKSDAPAPTPPLAPGPTVAPRDPTIPKLAPQAAPQAPGSDAPAAVDRTNPQAREQRHKDRIEAMAAKLDTDGDGKVTVQELAKAEGRLKFDDPAAVDTNHDGVISPDELGAALQARRGGNRHHRGDGSATGSN